MQHQQQAELYLAQGKLEEAMAACKQALEIEPNFPPTCKTLGNILQRMGEIDKAKEWYIKALNQQPNWAEVYANLGSLYAQQQQWELAIESYKEAIGIKPNIAGFYRNLGKIWQRVGKIELARDCQQQADSLEAQYPTALQHLKQGKSLLELGEIEAAIACFQTAIELNPSLAAAYQNLGDALVKKKQLNEAIKIYQKARELQPESWVVYQKLGKVWQEIGELEAAISNFQLAIEINPKFPWSYKNLADILFQKGELEAAKENYQNLIKIQPDLWDAHRKLAEIQLQTGKPDALKVAPPLQRGERGSNVSDLPGRLRWEEVIQKSPIPILLYAGGLTERAKKDGWIGLSYKSSDSNHVRQDLGKPIPIPDNIVDAFQSEDVFEHIEPSVLLAVTFPEIYRIMKPGAMVRISVPDYRCDVLINRSWKDEQGRPFYDPFMGGKWNEKEKRVVGNGGGSHLWLPTYEKLKALIELSPLAFCQANWLHYYDVNGQPVMNEIDYSKGFIRRTPDNDPRVKNPRRPMSIVVDLYK